jgi:nucleoside-diphosphate-sugar epimerase
MRIFVTGATGFVVSAIVFSAHILLIFTLHLTKRNSVPYYVEYSSA